MPRDERVGVGVCTILWRYREPKTIEMTSDEFNKNGQEIVQANPDARFVVGDGHRKSVFGAHAKVEILLGHRCGSLAPDTWALPGGWHDANEQPLTTAIRELQEECGLDVSKYDLHLVGAFSHELQSIDCWCATIYYCCRRYEGSQKPTVCEPDKLDEWKWFTREELPENLFGATKMAIDEFLDVSIGYDHII